MASQYFAILTDYGTQAFAKALSSNQPLQLTQFAVGDGNGQAVTPTANRTTLAREKHRAPVSAVSLDPRNNKQVIVELTIPENIGGFYIREMGVFDAQNKLIAYANCPESFKPTENSGSGKIQVLRMILNVASSSAITLSVDHSVIFVTRQQMTPKSITATSTNGVDERGHSHEIAKASLTQQGIVQLDSSTNSNAEDKAATSKAVKTVKDQVDSVLRNQANYIPNSKKSSAVDSNSTDTIATSKAVKTAYDKGVEAKTAAENAHSAANNAQHTANEGVSKANEANSNANGRVSKSGDTMTGLLTALGFIANSPTASVMFRSQTALSAFLDFAQKNTQHALTTLESISFADNAAEFRMHLTPRGDNNNTDRREHTFTFQPGGNIWSKKFGWLDQYFGRKPTFTYYQHHYLGASVYKIPFSDTQCLKITLMLADHAWSDELILPEIYNGQFLVNAIDAGGGKDALGVFGVSNNRIKLLGDGGTRAAIFVFGEGPL